MFKRAQPRTILQNIREFFWPSMGWTRACVYTKHRIVRLSDSAQKIALGLAIGIAVSFSPFLGTHFIQAIFFACITRSNIMASLVGTVIGNPWTFPFIWWASMSFGSFLFGIFGFPASVMLPEEATFTVIWNLIKNDPFRIFVPWFVGGYLIAIFSVPLTYAVFYKLVSGAKLARKKAREQKLHRIACEVTGQIN